MVQNLPKQTSSPSGFLLKRCSKIWRKLTGGHSCPSVVSINLEINSTEITLYHGCSPVSLLHIIWLILQHLHSSQFHYLYSNRNLDVVNMVTSKCIVLHDTLFSCFSNKHFENCHAMGPEKVLRACKFRYCLHVNLGTALVNKSWSKIIWNS